MRLVARALHYLGIRFHLEPYGSRHLSRSDEAEAGTRLRERRHEQAEVDASLHER